MPTDKEVLRPLAEELARTEGNICLLGKFSAQNPENSGKTPQKKKKDYSPVKKWLLWSIPAVILFFPAAFYTFFKAYSEYNRIKNAPEEMTEEERGRELVTRLEEKRAEIISQLNQMIQDNPKLDGNYWWKLNKNPAFEGKRMPGTIPDPAVWKYVCTHHYWFSETPAGYILEDMMRYFVGVGPEDARKLFDPQKVKIIYRNEELLQRKNTKGYLLMHLYAVHTEPIEEVRKSTTVTAVDRKAEMARIRQKLDSIEIARNAALHKELMTDQERLLYGKSTVQEYVNDNAWRDLAEANAEARLRERGETETHDRYYKAFLGLYRVFLYNCADLLMNAEQTAHLECAAIGVPKTEQKIVQLYVRAPKGDLDNPFHGRLESYDGEDAIEEFEGGVPSVRMAVDQLMNPEAARHIKLRKRDVLAPRPKGLDDYEFSYLIWGDRSGEGSR